MFQLNKFDDKVCMLTAKEVYNFLKICARKVTQKRI